MKINQINIDKEEVVYMQNDMAFSNDSFVATITNLEVHLKEQVAKYAGTQISDLMFTGFSN